MKVLNDVLLSMYTTIKIGGRVNEMYFPENVEELIQLIKEGKAKYCIGGGSNILASDRTFETVISLSEFNKKIEDLGAGCYKVGASVRLQELIRTINKAGYGGIEYLISVPGFVGGATVMNAGGSAEEGNSISDFILSVECIRDGVLKDLSKEDCDFSHRNSVFKNKKNYIVTAVTFHFRKQMENQSLMLREKRLEYCRLYQDNSAANFGSVFSCCNMRIMKIIKVLQLVKKRVHFSYKTENWLCNEGGGTFKEAEKLIRRARLLHRALLKPCCLEVIIWK